MSFHLRRYARALRQHRHWAWLALLPLALYLLYAALYDVEFTRSQGFDYSSAELPVAASNSPTGSFRLSQLLAHPELFLLDEFALIQLHKKLGLFEELVGPSGQVVLARMIGATMSLTDEGDSRVRLSYHGESALLGDVLVAFYTDRLLKKTSEGMQRARSSGDETPYSFQLRGDMQIATKTALWSARRLLPATLVLVCSLAGLLLVIALVEFTDQSFKSERQIARYLELPILGAMPDVQRIARRLAESKVSNDP